MIASNEYIFLKIYFLVIPLQKFNNVKYVFLTKLPIVIKLYFAVADRVVDKHNFTLSKCELVAERFFGLKPNDKQSGPPPKESPGRNVNEQRKKKRGKGGIKSERRPVEEKITDDEEASPESSSDEHELESCSIEVSRVNKETSQETLKMFFENRRKSGGGQIENVWFNKSNGNYVITFKNREGKPTNKLRIISNKNFTVQCTT